MTSFKSGSRWFATALASTALVFVSSPACADDPPPTPTPIPDAQLPASEPNAPSSGEAPAPPVGPPPTPTEQAEEPRKFAPDRRMTILLERRTTIDLNLEGGLGYVFADHGKPIAFGRARAGVLMVRSPLFESLGITYEYSGLSPVTFGLQAELAWSGGLWGQLGALMDTSHAPARWGGMAAFGFALLGIEGQLRDAASTGTAWAVYAKIRLPITLLGLAASASAQAERERELERERERESKKP